MTAMSDVAICSRTPTNPCFPFNHHCEVGSLGSPGLSGTIRYQPISASAAACRRFIDIELPDRRVTDKWALNGRWTVAIARRLAAGQNRPLGARSEVASFQSIEDVRQAGVHDVSLVGEPAFLHHAARRPVVRQGKGNDSIQAYHVETQLQRRD